MSISLRICVFPAFSRKLCSANMTLSRKGPAASELQRIAGHAISVKLHPQEVLIAKHGTQYACSKRSEIDSIRY